MHILVTNDDGPPSSHSSPYVLSFVRELARAGHLVSVCLPHTQRSWIGKAHIIGKTVKLVYYRPPAGDGLGENVAQGTTHHLPSGSSDVEEWVLVDGTPASCVQIGLYHFFGQRDHHHADVPEIDLVVSGPNYGRNTTAVFALSSGTLGGALEASICRKRSIALSFAFFSRNHDSLVIAAACRHSVRIIDYLYKNWPTDGSVDLYSVNVPLVEGVESHKTVWTAMLQNYWVRGGCFQEVEGSIGDEDEEEERIREGVDGEVISDGCEEAYGHRHRHFKWAPRFGDVYKSVEEAGPGNDGWTVKEGHTSVTPLKANFCQAAQQLHNKELKLAPEQANERNKPETCVAGRTSLHKVDALTHLYAIIDYGNAYVQPLVVSAIKDIMPPSSMTMIPLSSVLSSAGDQVLDGESSEASISRAVPTVIPSEHCRILHISQYELLDFEFASTHQNYVVNSYVMRKALIRKHHLAMTIATWVSKRPHSLLKKHVKVTERFEVDYAQFLDDALVECWDLRESMARNANDATNPACTAGDCEAKGLASPIGLPAEHRTWWILKPGMSDRGQGLRLFSTMKELHDIFAGWESGLDDSDEDESTGDPHPWHQVPYGKGHDLDQDFGQDNDMLTANHLRHFVAQLYIHPPLLVPGDRRKFHIRAYVVCIGALQVYVYRPMLMLFSAQAYLPPWECTRNVENFLTNTCVQHSDADKSALVKLFWDSGLSQNQKDGTFRQICHVTGELFEAAALGMMMHFRPMVNAFEVFGIDFLVDEQENVWLLEVNSFPDFQQTGDDLGWVVAELWRGILSLVTRRFVNTGEGEPETPAGYDAAEHLVCVKQVDTGRQFGGL